MKYLLILLFAISCTPQKRMQRLLRKHPNLISVVDRDTTIRDTIIEKDTFITKEYIDSFIINSDTIIETHRVIVERIKDRFNVIVKPDTIIALDTIFYEKKIKIKGQTLTVYEKRSFWWYLIPLLVGFFLAWLFRK